MLVTTSQNANLGTELKAKKLASEIMFQYAERGTSSLSQLRRRFGDTEILVVNQNDLKFVNIDRSELFFHPNLAKIRLTSMLKGSKDRLLEVAGVKPGESVLDCTMGLATDAIMFSFAVGKSGKITTVESELITYVLAREGLKNYVSGIKELDESMRAVNVIHADHLDFMRGLPKKCFDVVYFDPMFRRPDKTVALTPLRKVANQEALKLEAISEAKRVARRVIVLREHINSGEFERLGFQLTATKQHSSIVYGTIR